MSRNANPAGRLRGSAVGLLTAVLAIAAHGVGGGAMPTGAATAQLAVISVAVGALAATIAPAADTRVLLGLLAAGQLLGHVMLATAGHAHAHASFTAPPAWAMLAAHLATISLGAVLIAAGDRLCRAVSRAVQGAVRSVCLPPSVPRVVSLAGADQPLRSSVLLAASVSDRGPPVSPAR
jgi:hypothetical protein